MRGVPTDRRIVDRRVRARDRKPDLGLDDGNVGVRGSDLNPGRIGTRPSVKEINSPAPVANPIVIRRTRIPVSNIGNIFETQLSGIKDSSQYLEYRD